MDAGDVRPPELFFQHEGGTPHGPAILLHEEALRFVWARSHGQWQGHVLDLRVVSHRSGAELSTGGVSQHGFAREDAR